MIGTQLPVNYNNATTGHKLQGTGVDNLFVSEWFHQASWIYVILSRVKTRQGLFLRKELRPDREIFKVSWMLKQKIKHFRSKCVREELTKSTYDDLCAL